MYSILDIYEYKEMNVTGFIQSIQNSHYIDLFMCNTAYAIIKDIRENYVILKNTYRALQFTFSDNLNCDKNKIIDIREIGGVYND